LTATGVLLDNGIAISMDERGRALDNIFVERLWWTVQYEDVYLQKYAYMPDLLLGLTDYAWHCLGTYRAQSPK